VPPSADAAEIRRRFTDRHHRRYGYDTDEPLECVNLRVSAVIPSPVGGLPPAAAGDAAAATSAAPAERRVFFYQQGWTRVPVYARGALPVDAERRLRGPAVVQDEWSTIVVHPGQALRSDGAGVLWIEAA
jgi:N-methylhydantoinase A